MAKVTIAQAIEQLKGQKTDQSDFKVARRDVKVANHGGLLNIKGKEYENTDTGKRTLCRVLHMPRSYFKKYPVDTEMSEHSNVLLQAKPDEELLIRTKGDKVRAVLDPKYAIYDNDKFLEAVHAVEPQLKNCTIGLQNISDTSCMFQILFGSPKVQQDETYPMIRLHNSEVGLGDLQIEMGLFRLVCTNGLVRKQSDYGYFKWKHTNKLINKIDALVPAVIDRGAQKWVQAQDRFEKARDIKLSRPLVTTVGELLERNEISGKFAKTLIKSSEATSLNNLFDVVNLITNEAQKMTSWSGRTTYEDLASRMLEGKFAI